MTDIKKLENALKDLSSELKSHGKDPELQSEYKLISSSYSQSSFGDSLALYAGDILEVKFWRDKGELGCEFRRLNSKSNWTSLYQRAPHLPRSLHLKDEPGTLKAMVKYIIENQDKLALGAGQK